jgi:hypothetical protein
MGRCARVSERRVQMGWRDEQREQAERTLDALDGIRTDIRALRTVPVADRGYVSELQRFPALQIALRLCVDRSDPHDVRGLVELFKRVPDVAHRPLYGLRALPVRGCDGVRGPPPLPRRLRALVRR